MKKLCSILIVLVLVLSTFSVVSVNADDLPSNTGMTEMEINLLDGPYNIFVSFTEVEGAVRYEFSAVSFDGPVETIVTTEPSLRWTPEYYNLQGNTCVRVKAFDEANNAIGQSKEEYYNIYELCADWWGDCGDANLDQSINIKDATYIQKLVAGLVAFFKTNEVAADADGNSDINVKDATAIQKFVAGLSIESQIGKGVWYGWSEYMVEKTS